MVQTAQEKRLWYLFRDSMKLFIELQSFRNWCVQVYLEYMIDAVS